MNNYAYPATVTEVIDRHIKFNASALSAVRKFKRSNPWSGSLDERHLKFRELHGRLCEVYGLFPPPRLIFGNDDTSCSGRSCFIPAMNTIVIRGRLSVVTYLHEFAHARGMDERSACRWSINLFRRVFKRQFERCRHDGHLLRATSQLTTE